MTEAQYEAYMEAEFYSYMGMNHSHHSHHDEGHFSTDCEPDAYLAPTSSLKSRIPWLSFPDDNKDETRSMILDVITKMKLTTEEGVLMSGLMNNLQDMFPNYLPNRLLLFECFPCLFKNAVATQKQNHGYSKE
jgi:hypothetical protein